MHVYVGVYADVGVYLNDGVRGGGTVYTVCVC